MQDLAALLEERGHRARDRAGVRGRVAPSTRCAAARTRASACRPGSGRSARSLQPRARHRERPRLPGESARVRGGAAGRRRWRRAASRVRLKPRAGATPADARVLASVESPPMARLIRAHEQAVGQLLRRDARQGPRMPGRRRRHHRRAARGSRPPTHARLGARRHARGRLRALARQPRLAARRRPAAQRACTASDDFDPFCDSLPIAGQRRHALRPHAQRRGALALPRQDRHALERERAVRLLRGPQRRQLRASRS